MDYSILGACFLLFGFGYLAGLIHAWFIVERGGK